MRSAGILNRRLAGALAEPGQGDPALVCDAGMPVPGGPRVVDPAFRAGVPSFADSLDGLPAEPVAEGATAAKETRRATSAAAALLGVASPRSVSYRASG
ncbi:hypothetical protein SSP531S_40000 [Streptomyces spongiicola]|uniref:D-ribose pyranase n=1 Tax=Streptomyces spongiicola TaxID=1690221 RepID=A0A388T324_9ACTN|nr:hypothetical protein SSP531S_40000 [Streptomyces spongiicola]